MTGNTVAFTDKRGEGRYGRIVREYGAFEGGIRYIIQDEILVAINRLGNVNMQMLEDLHKITKELVK